MPFVIGQKFALIAIAFLLALCVTLFALWRMSEAQHDAFVAEVAAAAEKAKVRNEAQQREYNRSLERTANDWAKVLDSVRADYARRMRYAGSRPMPANPAAPGVVDGATEDALPDPARLAADCAEVTVQLLYHQDAARQIQEIQREYRSE